MMKRWRTVRQSCRVAWLVLVLSSLSASLFAAQLYPKKASKKVLRSLDAREIMTRLDALVAEQTHLLQVLEEVKREAEIVKIRASRSVDSCT